MTTDKDQTIWKWENTAHITKMVIEGTVALASLAGAITAILIATKVIAGPASLALIVSPAGIAALFIAAIYFTALAYASYQQMQKNEEIGANSTNGKDGKDANFAALVGDAVKSGTIVEEEVNSNKQLSLKLSKSDYEALTQGKNVGDEIALNVLSTSKPVKVKFNHIGAINDNGNYKVQLDITDMKAIFDTDSKSLKVAVSNEALEALKDKVATNLANVALENAISNAKKV